MARRPKERLRTIQLDLDVSEIAQKLADKKELSSTLSELLRANYGFGDKLEEKKRELHAILDHIADMHHKRDEMIADIDATEKEFLERETNVVPQLKEKLVTLRAKYDLIKRQAETAIDASVRSMKYRAMEQFENQIQEVLAQLEEFQ
jgi:predicted  nucleic acid-binding Zn-ribbon protein